MGRTTSVGERTQVWTAGSQRSAQRGSGKHGGPLSAALTSGSPGAAAIAGAASVSGTDLTALLRQLATLVERLIELVSRMAGARPAAQAGGAPSSNSTGGYQPVSAPSSQPVPAPEPASSAGQPADRNEPVAPATPALAGGAPAAATPVSAVSSPGSGILVSREQVMSLPTSGAAWDSLVATANQSITPNLADQDNKGSSVAFAAALVYARTGNTAYRDKVVAALQALPGTETGAGARVLSVGRQLGGYVMAADLVGYREPSFVQWVGDMRTKSIGGHGRWDTLTQTHEDTASNWGTFAGVSRIAASLYVGDTADVARAAQVFKGWTDGQAWQFNHTSSYDPSWTNTPGYRGGVNPAGDARDGALIEDISRGESYPNATSTGLSYSWEALQGTSVQALLLEHAGYTDVWQWGDQALRRAVDFQRRFGGFDGSNFSNVDRYVPYIIDRAYGTSYATGSAGYGREFGFTDWLYGSG